VWGFADLHCHPMAAKGFGGGLIAGDYDPSLRDAAGLLHCDQPPDDHRPHFRDAGDFLVNNWPDAHPTGQNDGGATFTDWPNFMDGIHQQMHPEWITRARDGGLRLMVALVVHNQFLATQHVVHSDLPHDDWSVTQRQVQYWKDVCAAHPDIMAIALSPQDARAIIASGRIAVVLGLEVDSALAKWKSRAELVVEAYHRLPADRRPPVAHHRGATIPINRAMIDMMRAVIHEQLTALWNLGIRQINPVHLANNAFGYASVYDEAFNLSMSKTFGTQFQVAATSDVDFRLGEERDGLTYLAAGVFAGYAPNSGQWNATGVDGHGRPIAGHVNAGLGLTDVGTIAIQEMIRAGFIIDVDHMSRATAAQTFAIAEGASAAWNDGHTHPVYPLVSAHASFRDLSPRRNWGHENDPGPGQRAYNRMWSHESEKTTGQLQQLRSVGGMLASITAHIDSLQYRRADGSTPVANDCAGTTKTWAQELMYAVDAMGGAAVGMGTDMALLREIGPRFGPQAAYGLTDEHLDNARVERHNQALAQDAGVRYDRVASLLSFWASHDDDADWKRNPYIKPQDSAIDLRFADEARFATSLWIALAVHVAGGGQRPARDDANEVLRGLQASSAQDAQRISDRARTAWEVWNGQPVTHVDNDPRSDYHLITDAITMWRRMSGPNTPLSRCRTGQRDWDFNIDGLAHYGLLPDMLQDLANVGLPQDVMAALFGSAEAYLDLWQRCERWHVAAARTTITMTAPIARQQTWPSH
jgi:microsomal dipeptidase-like Zn-dependent dipeptidase